MIQRLTPASKISFNSIFQEKLDIGIAIKVIPRPKCAGPDSKRINFSDTLNFLIKATNNQPVFFNTYVEYMCKDYRSTIFYS